MPMRSGHARPPAAPQELEVELGAERVHQQIVRFGLGQHDLGVAPVHGLVVGDAARHLQVLEQRLDALVAGRLPAQRRRLADVVVGVAQRVTALVQQHERQQVRDGGVGRLRVRALVHALQHRTQLRLKVERAVRVPLAQHVPRR